MGWTARLHCGCRVRILQASLHISQTLLTCDCSIHHLRTNYWQIAASQSAMLSFIPIPDEKTTHVQALTALGHHPAAQSSLWPTVNNLHDWCLQICVTDRYITAKFMICGACRSQPVPHFVTLRPTTKLKVIYPVSICNCLPFYISISDFHMHAGLSMGAQP